MIATFLGRLRERRRRSRERRLERARIAKEVLEHRRGIEADLRPDEHIGPLP